MAKLKVETCLSPALFEFTADTNSIVVVIDILRATSAICAAFENGAKELIPVASVEEAKAYKDKGFLVAAERDGFVLDFADFGNSPFNFTPERVKNNTIVYSTTNGTSTIELAAKCYKVVIGSFLNISALSNWLINQNRNIMLLCAGWKNKVNIEDSFFAGALGSRLLENENYFTHCDSLKIALDLWNLGKDNPLKFIQKTDQWTRLGEKGLGDSIPFCLVPDSSSAIPQYINGKILKK